MRRLFWGLLTVISLSSHMVMADEFQTIDPVLDRQFVADLGLFQLGQPLPKRFNLLIVGQDNSNSRSRRDGRLLLGSRADVILVLSMDTSSGQSTLLSIYRGNDPGSGCRNRIGRSPSSDMINGVYSLGGREEFIPCLEGMLEQRLRMDSAFSNLLDEHDQFKVHAFFEGTRSSTIRPVAEQSLEVVMANTWTFTSIYGLSAIGAAMDVLVNGNDIQGALDDVGDYLSIELKERDAYRAAGYQRAFNFATVISTALGWSAYGIERHKDENYQFLGRYFGEVIANNFSASHDFNALEEDVFLRGGGHLLKETCYRNNVSPVRIVQWGNSSSSFVIYENGQFDFSHSAGALDELKIVPIIPAPPNCD